METPSDGGNTTLIERVLKLRRCMGIANELSTIDPGNDIFSQSQMEASERPAGVRSVHDHLQWYAFAEDMDGPSSQ